MVAKADETPEEIMARAVLIAQDTINRQKQQIADMQPKALFADAVAASHTSILVGELAKLLKQNGVEIGQNRLFRWLRENGYLMKAGSSYNMPTQRSMEQERAAVFHQSFSHEGRGGLRMKVKIDALDTLVLTEQKLKGLREILLALSEMPIAIEQAPSFLYYAVDEIVEDLGDAINDIIGR